MIPSQKGITGESKDGDPVFYLTRRQTMGKGDRQRATVTAILPRPAVRTESKAFRS